MSLFSPSTVRISLIAALLASSGCSLLYQPNIQQGNILTASALETLKLGMTHSQVRYLLGTPTIRDPFHKNRWDYYFSFQKDGGPRVQQRLTLIFTHGQLSAMRGDVHPTPHFPTPTGPSTASDPDAS